MTEGLAAPLRRAADRLDARAVVVVTAFTLSLAAALALIAFGIYLVNRPRRAH